MPTPSPFHPITSELCSSLNWKNWAGYSAVRSYESSHDSEYFAIRHGVGLIDVSPLFKYCIKGTDAGTFLSWVWSKDVSKLAIGRLTYGCWCDDEGHILDDGTLYRIAEDEYRMTAAEPTFHWLERLAPGFRVAISDVSQDFGALSVQGPNARALLNQALDQPVDRLRFFDGGRFSMQGIELDVTRTGYTGDLGYEVWVDANDAVPVYRRILEIGRSFGAMPAGLDAMDVARIEAGLIMNGVDYYSANRCIIPARKSNPYEISLGWTVQLQREPFVGQQALQMHAVDQKTPRMIGLELDWVETEALFMEFGLPPEVCSAAWRQSIPVYARSGDWIGYASSGAWSPLLKKNLALAHVDQAYTTIGSELQVEMTVEHQRLSVTGRVTKLPFLELPRKRG